MALPSPLERRQTEERTAMQSEVCWKKHGFQLVIECCIKHAAQRPIHTPRLNEERCAFSFNPFPLSRGE